MGQELLPCCPWCKQPGKAWNVSTYSWRAGCVNGECSGVCFTGVFDTEAEATNAWKRLAGTPPVGEIGALVEKLRKRHTSHVSIAKAARPEQPEPASLFSEAADALEAFAAHQEEWKPIEEAPEEVERAIAVHDSPLKCDWFFATKLPDGRWLDLSSGGIIEPTHFRPLPEPPRGDKPEVGL